MRFFIKFSDIINDSSKYDELGVGGISNADNANPKQLRWELDRDDFSGDGGAKRWKKGKKNSSGKLQKHVKNKSKKRAPIIEKKRDNKKSKASKLKRK